MNNDINNNPNNQNRPTGPIQKRPDSDLIPRKPAPQNRARPSDSSNLPVKRDSSDRSAPVRKRPEQNQTTQKIACDANMTDGFQAGHTKMFDTNRVSKPGVTADNQTPTAKKNVKNTRNGSETYHYTGRDIKSSRQRVTNINPNQGNRLKVTPNDDDDFDMSVSGSKSKSKSKNKRRDDNADTRKDGFVISGILKVLLYIIGVLLVSGLISYNVIMIANDVFAFVKAPFLADIVISEDADIETISQLLHESEIIKYPKIFDFYINYRKKDKVWEYEPGTYHVSSDLNYDELIYLFRKKAAAREIVRVTIPEGFTVDQIINRFVDEYGIGTREKFIEVINSYDFSALNYRFLKPLYENKASLSPDRKYMLEGYLFPDTYDFYKDESELDIITKFLDNFDDKFDEKFYEQAELINMSIDDIIILASMVEREAKFPEDFMPISAVFHNRLLNSAAFGGLLQSDATKLYDFDEHKSDLTQADLAIDSPYNTYTRKGLPPSAICNSGYEAIWAALWPEEKFPNYYFIADMNGKVFYSETLAQHEAHRERIRQEKAAAALQQPAT